MNDLIDFEEVIGHKCVVDVEFKDLKFQVAYRPTAYDDDLQAEMDRIDKSEDEAEKLKRGTKWLLRMLAGWNLANKGKELPVTEANLRKLGIVIQGVIIKAIGAELASGN